MKTSPGAWQAPEVPVDAAERSPELEPPADPRLELRALCGALSAHVEALGASGAWGLPASPDVAERVDAGTPRTKAASPGGAPPGTTGAATAPPALAPTRPSPTASAAPSLPTTGLRSLEVVRAETQTCTKCGLHASRRQAVFARGTGTAGVAFVGEGPGEEEDRQGAPFVGPAGQLLDRMIAAMKLDRDEVYVCNVVKCRPPRNRKPDVDEMARCLPFLKEQLAVVRPRVIVALGATAVQGLLGTTSGITRLRGNWKMYAGKIPVMPTFHPAYLLRQPGAKREVWEDLKKVLAQLER